MPDKTELHWEHPNWLFVIIPAGRDNQPLFCGYCKTCGTYVTKLLEYPASHIKENLIGNVGLPQYGCRGPEGFGNG